MSNKIIITDNPNITRLLHERADIYCISSDSIRLSKPEEINSDWGVWDINQLPIIPSIFTYEFDVENYKTLKQHLNDAKGEMEIVNCCSPNRDGEYLFWTVMNRLVPNAKEKFNITRYWLNDLSESGIRLAKAKCISYNDENVYLSNIYNATYLESILSWLVGINFSRLCSKKYDIKINVGKEKTPLLKLLFDREMSFNNNNFFSVKNTFVSNGYSFQTYLSSDNGKKRIFDNKDTLKREFVVQPNDYSANELKTNSKVVKRPLAFDLYALQMDCLDLGLNPNETQEIALSLYEKGLITYPITENAYLSRECVVSINPDYFNLFDDLKLYSNLVTPDKISQLVNDSDYVKRFYYPNTSGICITNSDISNLSLIDIEFEVYHLISKRILSLFLEDTTVKISKFIITNGKNKFILTAKQFLEENAFLKLYENPTYFDEKNFELAESKIERVKQNRYTVKSFIAVCKDASLLNNTLDSIKLVSPNNVYNHLEELIKSQYIAIQNNEIYVNKSLVEPILREIETFQISSIETLIMCNKWLKAIEQKKLSSLECWKNIKLYVKNAVEEIKSFKDPSHVYCPKCGRRIVEYPKSYRCEGNCVSFSKVIKEANITFDDVRMLVNNGSIRKTVACARKKDGSSGYSDAALSYDGNTILFKFI